MDKPWHDPAIGQLQSDGVARRSAATEKGANIELDGSGCGGQSYQAGTTAGGIRGHRSIPFTEYFRFVW